MTDHIDRTMCSKCGTWYWAGDKHTCSSPAPAPGASPAAVLAAAFPDHGLARPGLGDAFAQAAVATYEARRYELDAAARSHRISARLVGLPTVADLVTRWRKK